MRNYQPAMKANLKTLLDDRGIRLCDLAARLGVHRANVSRWAKYGVSAERAVDIERETGIPRQTLRPDLWGGDIGTVTLPHSEREGSAA